jgi:hypothetical protein
MERIIPDGYVQFVPELGDYPENLFACYVNRERKAAKFFNGKRSKATWWLYFQTEERMFDKIKESIKNAMAWHERKQERKEERKKEILDVKVGDVLYSSWGWEQTNVDFYQVVETKGKTFTIREIKREYHGQAPSGGMSDYVSPIKDDFIGEPIVKRSFKLNSYSWLDKTEWSKKHFCSWYA